MNILTEIRRSRFTKLPKHRKTENIVYFECDNLDEEVERLKKIGLQFDCETKDQSRLRREIYLKDPNENKICLYYAGENRQNPLRRVE